MTEPQGANVPPRDNSISPRLMVGLIIGGLLIWGLYHAVGAFRHGLGGGLIVVASFALFVGFWGVLLAWRKRASRRGRP